MAENIELGNTESRSQPTTSTSGETVVTVTDQVDSVSDQLQTPLSPQCHPQAANSENNSERNSSNRRESQIRSRGTTPGRNSNNNTDYLYYDPNTFKQVKRLYCGMLMVAMAYSITMIIMMIILYKTLPTTMNSKYPLTISTEK